MRTVSIKLKDMAIANIQLGFVGENNATQVIFDSKEIFDDNPYAVQLLVVTPPEGTSYEVTTARIGDNVIWNVSELDTAFEGDGSIQLVFTDGGQVIKTYNADTTVLESQVPSGTAPATALNWIQDAEAWAKGTRGGRAVEDDDPTYQNNSKYYAEKIVGQAEDSEAYAAGTRNGEPVESDDPAYHNNSKYYAESIADDASDSEAYAKGTRGGEAVDEDDPAYHNNAAYYNDQAALEKAAAQAAAETASAAYNVNLLAANYDATKTYAVGEYVIYNGGLYRCISAITTAEAWTAAHWSSVTVGKDTSELKSAFEYATRFEIEDGWNVGKRIATNTDPVDFTLITRSDHNCMVIDCVEGDIFTITGQNANSTYRLFCFCKDDGTVVLRPNSNMNVKNRIFVTPSGATKLIVNVLNTEDYFVYKGARYNESEIETFDGLFAENLGIKKSKIYSSFSVRNTNDSVITSVPFIVANPVNWANYVITTIRMYIKKAGTLSIGYLKVYPTVGETHDPDNVVIKEVVTFEATGENTINLSTPFVIPANCYLLLGQSTDTAVFYFGSYGDTPGFIYTPSGTGEYTSSDGNIGIDVYGYDMKDYTGTIMAEKKVNLLESQIGKQEITAIDGYNASNSTSSIKNYFIITKNVGVAYNVTGIKLKVKTAGLMTIGTVKKTDAVNGESADLTKLKVFGNIKISTTGEQTISLDVPMLVKEDEYIFFSSKSDTAVFYFGSNGNDKGFLYPSNGTYSRNSGSLGITVYGYYFNIQRGTSTYNGKTLSILGDSISTFEGYIPEGNVAYYPHGTITSVSDTWWYKLMTALGMTLNVNNSWSGSRVTTRETPTNSGVERCEDLGTSPDVIIVWMGINDFNGEVPLGTYDGRSAIPNVTTTFREAYGIMLNKILTKYQSSEVWVCTLPQCERNSPSGAFPEINNDGVPLADFNKAIKELAEAFGVKVLDHNKSGLTYQNMSVYDPDELHPNKAGHSLVANNDIRQMDNFIRIRY